MAIAAVCAEKHSVSSMGSASSLYARHRTLRQLISMKTGAGMLRLMGSTTQKLFHCQAQSDSRSKSSLAASSGGLINELRVASACAWEKQGADFGRVVSPGVSPKSLRLLRPGSSKSRPGPDCRGSIANESTGPGAPCPVAAVSHFTAGRAKQRPMPFNCCCCRLLRSLGGGEASAAGAAPRKLDERSCARICGGIVEPQIGFSSRSFGAADCLRICPFTSSFDAAANDAGTHTRSRPAGAAVRHVLRWSLSIGELGLTCHSVPVIVTVFDFSLPTLTTR
eukprot:SAG31_NODE_370_length_16651_cov_3.511056_18_plen_280_part_00